MSADNYIVVKKEDAYWIGYMQYASQANFIDNKLFSTDVLEDAIALAQAQDTEYGYKFMLEDLYEPIT